MKKNTRQMNGLTMALVIVAAGLLTGGTAAFATDSAPVLVDAAYRNKHWTTVYTNTVPLTWDWNTNAASATLVISGMGGVLSTNFATITSKYLWQAFATSVPSAEDVYDLTLTFYSGGSAVVGALTSRLAVVTGAFGQTTVNPVAGSSAWAKVRNNVVIPYDATWQIAATNATTAQFVIAKVSGAAQTNAFENVAGYTGWKLVHSGWGYGTFDLSLTFPGTAGQLTATLMRPMDGTMIRMQ